jgi:MFS family permease
VKIFSTLDLKTRHNLLILFIIAFLFWLSLTSLLPVIPAYVADLGGTKQQIGLVMGSFAIGLLLSRTFLGKMADQKGRKQVVLIGTAVVALAPIGYLFINTVNGLMAVRAFHGISIAAFTIGYSALVVDLSPVEKRGELVGYMSLALPIGMTLGPAVGSLLQENIGYEAEFLFCIVAGLISFFLTLKITENKRVNQDQFSVNQDNLPLPNRNFKELLVNSSFFVPTFVLFMGGSVFGVLTTFLPLFIRGFNTEFNGDFSAGFFYTIAAIASFVIRILTGKASDRYGRGLFIVFGIICFSLSMVLLSYATSVIYLILAAIVEGFASGILIPLMIVLISDRCYATERGKVYSLCLGGYDLGIAIAGPISGYFAETISYSLLFIIVAIINLSALFAFLTQSNKTLINSLKFSLGLTKDYHAQ